MARLRNSRRVRGNATRLLLTASLCALVACRTSTASRDIEHTREVASASDEPRWTSMDDLRAMTEAGNYTRIRERMLGCFIRVEDYEVIAVSPEGRLQVGNRGSYPAFLYGPDVLEIEKGAVLDVEGILVDEGYSCLHIWVRSVEVKRRGP